MFLWWIKNERLNLLTESEIFPSCVFLNRMIFSLIFFFFNNRDTSWRVFCRDAKVKFLTASKSERLWVTLLSHESSLSPKCHLKITYHCYSSSTHTSACMHSATKVLSAYAFKSRRGLLEGTFFASKLLQREQTFYCRRRNVAPRIFRQMYVIYAIETRGFSLLSLPVQFASIAQKMKRFRRWRTNLWNIVTRYFLLKILRIVKKDTCWYTSQDTTSRTRSPKIFHQEKENGMHYVWIAVALTHAL